EDSAPYAGRLYDRLGAQFGADQVFMDVDDIPPGADFGAHIGAKVGSCDALVAVIGKNWLSARNDSGRLRLSDPSDYVGLEIALALQRGVLVIPVLVGGATMPKPAELRGDLRALAERNALTLNDAEFQRDAQALVHTLEKLPGLRKPTAGEDPKAALRKRLLRRLIWKVPLILALVSFAIWWQWRSNQEQEVVGGASGVTAKTGAAITGAWSGEVQYDWGDKYTEAFLFQAEDGKLFGTASFLAAKRGIEEGKIDGETISFFVRFQEVSGDVTREHKNYYWGKLSANAIVMRIQDDRGSPPVDFMLRKSAAAN
ncbi:MAG: toll/interleukin-1 receptor domain-containing protein, partial [Candidatus Binatia bacterium]